MALNLTEERERKLPVWAQERLSLLRELLATKERDLEALTGGAKTKVWARFYAGPGPDGRTIYLPDDSRVFVTDIHGFTVQMHRHGGSVRISADSALDIMPDASNAIHVRGARRG